MKKQLEELQIQQRYVEILGALKGCLDYLGRPVSFPWLYGATGHAFILSLDPGVDVSSPYTWDDDVLFDLAPGIGFRVDGLKIWRDDAGDSWTDRQCDAWRFVRSAIDRDTPCFGWELKAHYGGYWVITGYDDGSGDVDAGYYYSGWETGGPTPWQKLGELFVPLLEVHSVDLCDAAPDRAVVREGLSMALKFAENPTGWLSAEGLSGAAAFAYWAGALETGEAKRDDHTYNAQLWLECREMAVAFLQEAKGRLPGCCDELFDRAADQYRTVCAAFREIVALHPARTPAEQDWQSTFASPEAAALVRAVGQADAEGLNRLRDIWDRL